MAGWFEVDKEGLAKLLEKRGKEFVLFELIQNCWDTDAKTVDVTLKSVGRGKAEIVVEDDHPDGFSDLTHAYTLFAESEKKSDPSKRGRFNLGEKLVLAICEEATVLSTKGGYEFTKNGGRKTLRSKRSAGSEFRAIIRMTQDEVAEASKAVHRLLVPSGVTTTFNGEKLKARKPIATFETALQTLKSNDEGHLTRTTRKTKVRVYEPRAGEKASIYEMGIPVVETGDSYHVDVQQKVPVNMDRDNVPPSYLRALRVHVLNATFDKLDEDAAGSTWVTDAMAHEDVAPAALTSVITERFGKDVAIFDMSDTEANNRLSGKGYSVVAGGTFPKDVWSNIKKNNTIKPSGVIAPTPHPSDATADRLPESQWSEGMHEVVRLAKHLADKLMGVSLEVVIVRDKARYAASYSSGGRGGFLGLGLARTDSLYFNLNSLGRKWFDQWETNLDKVLELLVHEFGHHYAGNHFDEKYHDGLTKLAGKLAVLALSTPALFKPALARV